MLASQLEILDQGRLYLQSISESEYTAIVSPNFISSAGAHMRHIIDHYLALMDGLNTETVDYDIRRRGGIIESNPKAAIKEIEKISNWIKRLSETDLNKNITLSTEISITQKTTQTFRTSIARELIFAGSHAVHHYAMIAQIAFSQKICVPEFFGIAPTTATFLRGQESQNLNSAFSSS